MKTISLLCLAALTSPLLWGQTSNIDRNMRYAYAANAGWMDLRPSFVDGVRVSETCLGGYAYAVNFGWISLGSGAPANGHTYSNGSATDYGVNVNAEGQLAGFAYCGNIGWIVFEQSYGQPQLNLISGEISGYAYSSNIGWISLKTTVSSLFANGLLRPDSDGDGISDHWEARSFGSASIVGAITDLDADGASDQAEYIAGTSPTDASSVLRITAHSYSADHSEAAISFTVAPHRLYRIEHNDDLQGPWTDCGLGPFHAATGPEHTQVITGLPAGARCFFRVVVVNPL
jgi:hypothetical protein